MPPDTTSSCRLLTAQERDELRDLSTRAQILCIYVFCSPAQYGNDKVIQLAPLTTLPYLLSSSFFVKKTNIA